MAKGKMKRRLLSLILAASMAVALTGCAGGGEGAQGDGMSTDEAPDGASGSTNGQTAMGRYVEEEIDLSDVVF